MTTPIAEPPVVAHFPEMGSYLALVRAESERLRQENARLRAENAAYLAHLEVAEKSRAAAEQDVAQVHVELERFRALLAADGWAPRVEDRTGG